MPEPNPFSDEFLRPFRQRCRSNAPDRQENRSGPRSVLVPADVFLAPPSGMSQSAWHACGLALWMAVWWMTEALPLPVTALLPLVVLRLTEILPLRKAWTGFGVGRNGVHSRPGRNDGNIFRPGRRVRNRIGRSLRASPRSAGPCLSTSKPGCFGNESRWFRHLAGPPAAVDILNSGAPFSPVTQAG